MGFFDSMKKGFEDESNKIKESREHSNYRTVKAQEQERYDDLNRKSDSALFSKMNSAFTSNTEKNTIAMILNERGYKKDEYDRYNR